MISWLSQHVRRLNLAVWVPVGLILVLAFALSVWAKVSVRRSHNLVLHSHRVINAGKDVLLAVDDAETGQRGYLLTGVSAYLLPYEQGQIRATSALQELATLVADSASQAKHAALAKQQADRKLQELKDTIGVYEKSGFVAARAKVLENDGKSDMDALRETINTMEESETQILAARDLEVARHERIAIGSSVAVALLSFVSRLILSRFGRKHPT